MYDYEIVRATRIVVQLLYHSTNCVCFEARDHLGASVCVCLCLCLFVFLSVLVFLSFCLFGFFQILSHLRASVCVASHLPHLDQPAVEARHLLEAQLPARVLLWVFLTKCISLRLKSISGTTVCRISMKFSKKQISTLWTRSFTHHQSISTDLGSDSLYIAPTMFEY